MVFPSAGSHVRTALDPDPKSFCATAVVALGITPLQLIQAQSDLEFSVRLS